MAILISTTNKPYDMNTNKTTMLNNNFNKVCIGTLFFLCLSCNFAIAQDIDTVQQYDATGTIDTSSVYESPYGKRYNFVLVARSYGDSIVLRWAPENAGVWISANYYGWNILRDKNESEIRDDDTTFNILLNDKPIKPLSLDEMMKRYDSTNIFIGAAAQALYGESYYNPKEGDGLANYVFRRDQEQNQRMAMAYLAAEGHPEVADALGLRFVDTTVKVGHTYMYRVESLIPQEQIYMPAKFFMVNNIPYVRSDDEKIPEIQIHQNGPFTAFVYWEKNKLSGYYVERSSDNGKTWEKLNSAPIYGYMPDQDAYDVLGEDIGKLLETNVGIMDSLKLNVKYQYRVKAFDAFGDYAPERTSEKFEMEDRIPPTVPVLAEILPKDNKACTLQWFMDKEDDDLKGFIVAFSDVPEGPWNHVTELLPPTARQWTDKDAEKRGRGYFRIFAVDKSQNFSYSTSKCNNIEDVFAPAPPTGFAAQVDTAGVVNFNWNKSPEKDVYGYHIYYANKLDHEFIPKNGPRILENEWRDTISLNTLTKYVFFYVVAEDYSHNISLPSDTLAVPVPDTIPPGIALLEDYTTTNESVTFKWLQSTSEDVAYYYIYRKFDNEKQWKYLRIITPDELEENEPIIFTDYPEPSPKNYNYCIEVIDRDGLSSGKTGQTTIRLRGAATVKIPLTLKASPHKSGNGITIDFTYEYKSHHDYYGVIYKSVNDEPAYVLASFNRGEHTYNDFKVNSGDKVTYYIRMMLGDGKRSQPSETVTVKVK